MKENEMRYHAIGGEEINVQHRIDTTDTCMIGSREMEFVDG